MKTSEEMVNHLLERRDAYEAERKKRKKTAIRLAAPALSLCLAAALGLGLWRSGLLRPERPIPSAGAEAGGGQTVPEAAAPSPTEAPEQGQGGGSEAPEEAALPGRDPGVGSPETGEGPESIFGGSESMDFAIFRWRNRLGVYGELYWALEADPEGTFEVAAAFRPATAEISDFIYEGRPLSQWAVEAAEEQLLPQKMTTLLKLGDSLKYGEALCGADSPTGEVWDRRFYENTVAGLGEELLGTYLADGVFLREELERDIAEYHETAAQEAYEKAFRAYADEVLSAEEASLTAQGISCRRSGEWVNVLLLTVTADELEQLPLADVTSWYFMSGEHPMA